METIIDTEVKAEQVHEVHTLPEGRGVSVPTQPPASEKPSRQEITAEEKLSIREVENSYLKAQMEISRLSQSAQAAQRNFTQIVDNLTKKYAIDPATWVFDNVILEFRRK